MMPRRWCVLVEDPAEGTTEAIWCRFYTEANELAAAEAAKCPELHYYVLNLKESYPDEL
jgi:hypothetical protein